jgi:hypothetical protein
MDPIHVESVTTVKPFTLNGDKDLHIRELVELDRRDLSVLIAMKAFINLTNYRPSVVRVYDGQRNWDIQLMGNHCPQCGRNIRRAMEIDEFEVRNDGVVECMAVHGTIDMPGGDGPCGHAIGYLVPGI